MAMGEPFLSAPLQVAIEKLASPVLRGFRSRLGIDKDLRNLGRRFSKFQLVLDDAEAKQISNKTVELWLNDLKDVAYDIDDVLDEVATEALRFELDNRQVQNFFSFKQDVVSKLELAIEKLDDIEKDRDALGLKEGVKGARNVELRERPQTSSLIDESSVFGRVEDKKKMVELLVSDHDHSGNCNSVSVISIVGMGGLGKTTFAQLVYNDEKVKGHFELRMWICVSDDFDVRRLTKSIMESATGQDYALMDLDVLQTKLQEILRGKRFLLVLDDVWNEKSRDWDVLRLPFRVGAEGSKIVITTRSEKVSSIMGATTEHRLEGLSDGDCWLLFEQRAFVDGNSEAYPKLVVIGKEILKKCQGLPLAAKTLGGLLHSKIDEYEWDMILKSDIWDLPEDENEILPALRLSYNHLPSHLKQCFAYCSLFPKDHLFEKETLVLLWIAEGFIHSKGRKRLEDMASEYFDDLLLRSFFQISKINKSRFIMHDLIHDLAQHVSGELCFTMQGNKSCNISEKARHASLLFSTCKSITFEAFNIAKSLRTFLLLCDKHTEEISNFQVPHSFILSLWCLRVLDLSLVALNELPTSIGNLKHLRYIDLSYTYIKSLPDSICSLYNLQTLILTNCNRLNELPRDMRSLSNLRHLDLTGCWHLISMPPRVGTLTSLQTLNRFVVGKESGCGVGELKGMMQLRGDICIDRLEDVVNVIEAKEANLNIKQYLHKLVLEWTSRPFSPDGTDEAVLEGLQPHTNLQELKIDGYHGVKFPSWMGFSSLSHLVKIELFRCNYCKVLPPLGQLPSLKYLGIDAMYELEYMDHEFCGDGEVKGFPSLETLKLEDMQDLKRWHGVEDGEFPFLRELIILNCPKMTTLPWFPSLQDLVLVECHEMILSSLPYFTSLSSLKISRFRRLTSLPDCLLHPLNVLTELRIQHCYHLLTLQKEAGIQKLASLHRLEILCCPKLETICKEGLPTTLRHFSIRVCGNLKSLPKGLQDLSSLEELEIYKCPQLVSFPEERLPVTLKHLTISTCPNLKSLPMGLQDLSSLEVLAVEACSQLTSLPEEGLPATLRSLRVRNCDLLEKRCQNGGEDWPKIAHIPNVHIGEY